MKKGDGKLAAFARHLHNVACHRFLAGTTARMREQRTPSELTAYPTAEFFMYKQRTSAR